MLSASSEDKCSLPLATRHEAVRRCNQAQSDVRILSDDLSCLPSRHTGVHCDGVRVSYWGPLGREWSHIIFNHPLQGHDVMFLICFLLLPSDTLSGVLADGSFLFVPFRVSRQSTVVSGLLFFFFFCCSGVVIYVAITPTVSPVTLIPRNIKLFSLPAIGSIDVAWVSFPLVSVTDSGILLTFSSRFHLLPAVFSLFFLTVFCFFLEYWFPASPI